MELQWESKLRLFLAYMGDLGNRFLGALGEGTLPRATVTAFFLLGILLLFMLYRSFSGVELYSLDWDGRPRLLGRLRIRRKNGIGILRLPVRLVESSRTTAFCLKPGRMARDACLNEELMIYYGKDNTRCRVEFGGSMRFFLEEKGAAGDGV